MNVSMNLREPTGSDSMIDVEQILNAAARISAVDSGLIRTPMPLNSKLSALTGGEVYLKCEHLQFGGSFKLRGALNKMAILNAETPRPAGVIAASSGNHGVAVAIAARQFDLPASIYLPGNVAATKRATIERLGADAICVEGDALLAEITARKAASLEDKPYLSPYNDHAIVAGQGTMGLEMLEDCPNLDAVLVAVGGGGMASGIGVALKAAHPEAQLTGVWPQVAQSMHACLQAGKIVEIEEAPTLSDGTAGGIEEGAVTLAYLKALLDQSQFVSELSIRRAMRWLLDNEHWVIEGSGALPLAALLDAPAAYAGKRLAIVLCGRNIDSERYLDAVHGVDASDLA